MSDILFSPIRLNELELLIENSLRKVLSVQETKRVPQQDKLITRKEAAAMLCVTLPTLQSYTMSGKLQGYRMGRRVLYKREEVNQAITAISTSKRRA